MMHLSHLGTCHNNEEVEMAVREWLDMQQPYFYCNETQHCEGERNVTNLLEDYVEK
jgi:hypothetical protein